MIFCSFDLFICSPYFSFFAFCSSYPTYSMCLFFIITVSSKMANSSSMHSNTRCNSTVQVVFITVFVLCFFLSKLQTLIFSAILSCFFSILSVFGSLFLIKGNFFLNLNCPLLLFLNFIRLYCVCCI